MTDKKREAFEEWFRNSEFSEWSLDFEDGEYIDSDVSMMYAAVCGVALTQQPESEPVGEYDGRFGLFGGQKYLQVRCTGRTPDKGALMYTSPQPSAQVPDGWQLVPQEPTEDMNLHGWAALEFEAATEDDARMVWDAMLNAAPSIAEKREWISCEERLPTESDADFKGNIWAFRPDRGDPIMIDPVNVGLFPFTHWMTTGLQRPEPPEVQS